MSLKAQFSLEAVDNKGRARNPTKDALKYCNGAVNNIKDRARALYQRPPAYNLLLTEKKGEEKACAGGLEFLHGGAGPGAGAFQYSGRFLGVSGERENAPIVRIDAADVVVPCGVHRRRLYKRVQFRSLSAGRGL